MTCISIILQPTDLEFVQVKERNILLDEDSKSYLHYNFLVKGLDGKQTMFFAELRLKIIDEKDVLLCMPLGEDDFKQSKESDKGIFIFSFNFLMLLILCALAMKINFIFLFTLAIY